MLCPVTLCFDSVFHECFTLNGELYKLNDVVGVTIEGAAVEARPGLFTQRPLDVDTWSVLAG